MNNWMWKIDFLSYYSNFKQYLSFHYFSSFYLFCEFVVNKSNVVFTIYYWFKMQIWFTCPLTHLFMNKSSYTNQHKRSHCNGQKKEKNNAARQSNRAWQSWKWSQHFIQRIPFTVAQLLERERKRTLKRARCRLSDKNGLTKKGTELFSKQRDLSHKKSDTTISPFALWSGTSLITRHSAPPPNPSAGGDKRTT